VKLGQSAVFVCEANGNPRPSIGWKREDDRPLSGAKAGNNFRYFLKISIFSVKRAWLMKKVSPFSHWLALQLCLNPQLMREEIFKK
jgi:hypothetical protein